jgi:hypothetical protein
VRNGLILHICQRPSTALEISAIFTILCGDQSKMIPAGQCNFFPKPIGGNVCNAAKGKRSPSQDHHQAGGNRGSKIYAFHFPPPGQSMLICPDIEAHRGTSSVFSPITLQASAAMRTELLQLRSSG